MTTEETQQKLLEVYESIAEILMEDNLELSQSTIDALQKALWELEDIID